MMRLLQSLFAQKKKSRRPSKFRQPRRLTAEALENRNLLSVSPYTLVGLGPVPGSRPAEVASSGMSAQALLATHTTITASTLAALTNESITFTATVTGPTSAVPGGAVEFFDGATIIGGGVLNSAGVATFTTSKLAVGIHRITATYEGNLTYHNSSSPSCCAVSVRQDFLTSTTLAANSPTTYGQLATLTATVKALNLNAGIPAGSIVFTDGQTVLGTVTLTASGTATLTGVKLPAGLNVIIASYQGGGQFDTSSSARCDLAIARASTAMTLATSLPSASVGQSVTFTATVSSLASGTGSPTGSVSFYDGLTLLGTVALNSNGVATFSTSALTVADHTIRAVYQLTTDFLNSSASVVQKVVAKKAS